MTLLQTLLLNLSVIFLVMSVLWAWSVVRCDASIVDPFWGTGFILISLVTTSVHGIASPRDLVILGLVTAWGLRLSGYLLWRNWSSEEDQRYAAMRLHHGRHFWWFSLFSVFLLQAVLLWFVSLPIQWSLSIKLDRPFGWIDATGIVVWGTGFLFETVGDWQLARFKAQPSNAGQVMDRGLWYWTRHPNYFGDCCVWWGIYMIATAGGAAWTICSPLLMTILLVRVSGVALLERTIEDRRPEYLTYKARTSAFIPWPPKY